MKAHHVLVAGSSGGGKTTLARQYHAEFEGSSIFLTTKKNERTAERDPPTRIRKSSCTYPKDVHIAREWALKREGAVQVIVDEADSAMPDSESKSGPGSGNPLREGLHKDREERIKYVVCTQDPSDLYYPPLKQCQHFVFVGEPAMWMEGFFRYFNIPREDVEALEDYEYVVMTRSGKVVYKGRTDPKYG